MARLVSLVLFSACSALAVAACATSEQGTDASASGPTAEMTAADQIARGEYLVNVIDCDTCHTPKVMTEQGPVPDMTRRLSGHPSGKVLEMPGLSNGWSAAGSDDLTAWAGPWGISYAANLTPHETTGSKIWTEQMFIDAIRTGRHMGVSRQILPPMPYYALNHLPDEDLKAILAFLHSLPPIENQVPQPTPPPGQ